MTETFLLFRKNYESTEYDISGFCGTFICQSLSIIIVFMIYIYIYIYISPHNNFFYKKLSFFNNKTAIMFLLISLISNLNKKKDLFLNIWYNWLDVVLSND